MNKQDNYKIKITQDKTSLDDYEDIISQLT